MNTKKLVALFLFALLTAAAASAQKTTVTATIVDPNGIPYANGSVTAQLVPAGVSNPTVGGNAINGTVGPAATDDNGHFSMDLFCNTTGGACTTAISPAGTKWQFTVCNPGVPSPLGFGNQCFTPAAITITGTTQDVSTQMNAVAPVLTRLVGVRIFSGPPTGSCTAGQLAVDSTTGTLYSCNGGVWQLVGGVTNTGAGPPGGSCQPNQLYVDTTTGVLYTCNGGTWTPAAGGGGTVTGFSYSSSGLDPLMTSQVTNPSTTPNLAQTAANAPLNTFLAGPVNVFLDKTAINTGNSNTVSITATPAVSTESAISFAASNQAPNPIPAPSGGSWSTIDAGDNTYAIYTKAVGSTSPFTASTTLTNSNPWATTLSLVGGTPVFQQGVVIKSTVSGTVQGCHTAALTGVVAGRSIIVLFNWTSASPSPTLFSVSDDKSDSYIALSRIQGSIGQAVFFAANVTGGTTNVTACIYDGSVSTGFKKAYEISGISSFFTGANGPYSFRAIAPSDLTAALGSLGFSQIQVVQKTSGTCTPPSNNTYDACTDTLTWPIAFQDTNYVPLCWGTLPNANTGTPANNFSLNLFESSHTTTTITVITQNNRGTANNFSKINCVAVHQ